MAEFVYSTVSLSCKDQAFLKRPAIPMTPAGGEPSPYTMVVDPSVEGQPMLGMGSIWTDTDLHALLRMSPEKQQEALVALFDREKGLGWNFMRLPFGSTDWEVTTDFYTYDDMPRGEKDWDLSHFSIQRDIDRGYFEVIRRCKQINPDLVFLGSVWGMPAWMKENDSIMYGRIDMDCVEVYARYLAKTALAYKEQGIDLYAITPQNESLTANDRATPATRHTWWMQKEVVLAMRRAFDEAGLDTRIWVYDHNFDMSDFFVKPMLADEACRKALDGVAFHDYGGDPYVMGELVRQYPDIPFYMTERTITSVPEMDNLVRELRNGARSYLQWTTMSDEYGGPPVYGGNPFVYGSGQRNGGAPQPESRLNFLYNLREEPDALFKGASYGIYGQFTRYLKRDMVRVDSTYGHKKWLTGVAFKDPKDGHIALVVVNQTQENQPLTIRCGGGEATLSQPAMSVATYCFTPERVCGAATCKVDEVACVDFPEPPTWDIAVEAIHLNGAEKAGEDLLLSAVVRNVGHAPTPAQATLYVQFSEDGDNLIARAHVPMPVLQPGETFEAVSNVPFGMPYCYKVAWTAEAGHHQIFARATVGNAPVERWIHNNVWAEEYDFV